MIAVDTNLLICAHRAGVPEHSRSRHALERLAAGGSGWGIPAPCLAEFWSVVTHPACEGGPSTPDQALSFILLLLEDGGGTVWQAGPDSGLRLMRIAGRLGILGARVFDLQIALAAFENGAKEIWSHDREFVAVPGLAVVDPLASDA